MCRRHPLARAAAARSHARGDQGRHGPLLAAADERFADAVGGTREGGTPPRDSRRGERGLGPEELVHRIAFRYMTDALPPVEAIAILSKQEPMRAERAADIQRHGYPAYTTSAGWLGYPDDKISRLCREGLERGWSHFKVKVGRDLADDLRRAALVRREIGPDRKLMLDANQVWDVGEAVAWMCA